MSEELKQTATGVSVDHVLAGLAVWAVAMVVFLVFL